MDRFSLLIFDILKNRKTGHFLKEFQKTKQFTEQEIRKYQFNKLKKLLFHTSANVPFYRQRFEDCGFSIDRLQNIEQIAQIPPLTREDLQNCWQDMIAENYDKQNLSKGSSSGSTGHPVFYFKDKIASSAGQGAHLLGWSLSGWQMSLKGLHIWGNPSTVNHEWKRVSSKLKAKFFAHHKFPAYKLTDDAQFEQLYTVVEKNRYDYLDGYTNAIYLFADYLNKKNLKLSHPIQYVLTTAENLQDFQRDTIERFIGPVFDTYGCSEINGIAYECGNCDAYHIIDPHVYVEFGDIVDDVGSKELLITDLDNYAFPLIRYQNDDLGIPDNDTAAGDCNLAFTRIKKISGRQSDIIRLKGGGTLSVPSFFGSMLLKQITGLKQYQVEIIRDDLIYVNLVKTKEFTPADLEILNTSLREYLDDKIGFEIRFLDKIDTVATGKFKLVVDRTEQR